MKDVKAVLAAYLKVFPRATVEFISPDEQQARIERSRFDEYCDILARELQGLKDNIDLVHRYRSEATIQKIEEFNRQTFLRYPNLNPHLNRGDSDNPKPKTKAAATSEAQPRLIPKGENSDEQSSRKVRKVR